MSTDGRRLWGRWPHYYYVVIKVLTLSCVLWHHPVRKGRVATLLFVAMEVQTLQISEYLVRFHPGWKARLFTLGHERCGDMVFHCVVWSEESAYCLKVLSFWATPILILWLQIADFGWSCFFRPAPISISMLSASAATRLRYMKLKENHKIHLCIFLWISSFPRQYGFSLSIFHSYVGLHILSGAFSCTQRNEQGKATVFHSPRGEI